MENDFAHNFINFTNLDFKEADLGEGERRLPIQT